MLGTRPLSTFPLSTLPAEFESDTAETTILYSTHSFVTRSSDNPALTLIPGRIMGGLTLARRLRAGPDGQFGSIIETSFGELVLNNADGALDPLSKDYYADGRTITLKIGAKEVVGATRITPQLVGSGDQDVTGSASTNVEPAYPTEGVVAGDLFICVLTINDRGDGGGLTSVPAPWTLLVESSNEAVYQAVLFHFAEGDEAGEVASFDWESVDGSNDVIVGRIRQFRYVDPDTPIVPAVGDFSAEFGGEFGGGAIAGNITLLSMPTVTTVTINSLAVAVAGLSDNGIASTPTGATGGSWAVSASTAAAATADGVADRIMTASIGTPGTISGGTMVFTPTGTEVSENSVMVGFALQGLPVAGGEERVQPYANFATVYTTVAGPWSHDHDALKLQITDLGAKLKDRLQLLVYSGAGGKSGTQDLAGRTRPLGFGTCRNITPQLVDPANFVFQASSDSVFAVDDVYDRGVELAFEADYATYEDLVAATLESGEYATSLAEGFIKVGGGADPGAITADLTFGDAETHSSVIRAMVVNHSALTVSEIDQASFDIFAAAQPAEIGIFFPSGDESTVEEAIEQVAFSGGAFAGQDGSGLYRVQRLEVPAVVPHWAFDTQTIVFDGGSRMARREPPYGVPWKAWGLGYDRNWTIQRASDVAEGVSAERKIYLGAEYRFVYSQNANVALSHQTSRSIIRRSLFLAVEDAEEEATRLTELYSLGRAIYEVPVKTALFSVRLGETTRLTYPRWGLQQGKRFVVTAVNDDADTGITDLVVFG